MTEFEEIYGDEFFVIDSNNLMNIDKRLYGYAIQNNEIIQDKDLFENINLNLDGAYIWVNVDEDNIYISQDFMGNYGLYFYEDGENYFAISNSFYKLVEHLKNEHPISFNKNYADAFIFAGLCSFAYNETLVNEIKLIPRTSKIIINKNKCQCEFEETVFKEGEISLDSEEGIQILDKWYNRWVNIFRFIKSKTNNIIVDISGGFDSRIVAAIWLTAGIDLNKIFIRSYNTKKHTYVQDFDIASQIAREFNFELNNDITRYYPEKHFHEIETTLNISFYLKLGFHKEMYFKYHKLIEPRYIITGGGGETIRGYYNKTPDEYLNSVVNYIKIFNEDISSKSRPLLDSWLTDVKTKFDISEDNSKELPERMYKEIRHRHHFGKAMIESYFSNEFTLCPLIDSELHKLKLTTDECNDRNLLMTLIYQRYCPKLLKFDFEGNRSIDKDTINYAIKLNEKYPLTIESKEIISGPDIKDYVAETENYFVKYDEANDLLTKLFLSKHFELEFEKYYSPEVYNKIVSDFKNRDYFPLTHMYAAIAILKFIHDTEYKTVNNNKNIINWINSFLNNLDYELNDELDPKIFELLLKYSTARIDLINIGSKENAIEIIECNDNKLVHSFPKWFRTKTGAQGLSVQSKKGILDLKIKCIKDGKLRIRFRGVDMRDKNNNRFPIFIDYTNIKINDVNLIDTNVLATHDDFIEFNLDIVDLDQIDIHCEWLPFNSSSTYKLNDTSNSQNDTKNITKNKSTNKLKDIKNKLNIKLTNKK